MKIAPVFRVAFFLATHTGHWTHQFPVKMEDHCAIILGVVTITPPVAAAAAAEASRRSVVIIV